MCSFYLDKIVFLGFVATTKVIEVDEKRLRLSKSGPHPNM